MQETQASAAQLVPIVDAPDGDAVQAGLNRLNALYRGQRSAVAASLLSREGSRFQR